MLKHHLLLLQVHACSSWVHPTVHLLLELELVQLLLLLLLLLCLLLGLLLLLLLLLCLHHRDLVGVVPSHRKALLHGLWERRRSCLMQLSLVCHGRREVLQFGGRCNRHHRSISTARCTYPSATVSTVNTVGLILYAPTMRDQRA